MVTLKGASAGYFGLSTDTKPTDAEVNSIFTELDTNTDYYFTGEEWEKVGGDNANETA